MKSNTNLINYELLQSLKELTSLIEERIETHSILITPTLKEILAEAFQAIAKAEGRQS
jgi:hypothetical protein